MHVWNSVHVACCAPDFSKDLFPMLWVMSASSSCIGIDPDLLRQP